METARRGLEADRAAKVQDLDTGGENGDVPRFTRGVVGIMVTVSVFGIATWAAGERSVRILAELRSPWTSIGVWVLGLANGAWLLAITAWATRKIRRFERRDRQATLAAHDREQARRQEEVARAELERTAVSERQSRLTAEDALRQKDDQLRQAQKMDAIGRLAGGVAHDFNNLLTVILSYADILAGDLSPGDPMSEGLDEIRKAGERASDLTRQLLAFSREQMLSPTVVDLDEVIHAMLKMLRRLIGASVDLTHVPAGDLGNVLLDRGQFEQVVLNLVVNARDAMPRGGRIVLSTSNVEIDEALAGELGVAPGPHVRVLVKDTGTGIEERTIGRIFEPFFTTKEKGKGTGLGLAVVFGIVRQSGGHIGVESSAGKGSTFTLHFPRTRASRTMPVLAPAVTATGGSETLLLVEDEDAVRHLACSILRRSGYHVLDAATPGDALIIGEQHEGPIHLLLTDLVMPRLSGERLSERIVALRPSIKVLYMSGYPGGAPHELRDTQVAFLSKPLLPDCLLRKVREVLDGGAANPACSTCLETKARRETDLRLERRRSRTHLIDRFPPDSP